MKTNPDIWKWLLPALLLSVCSCVTDSLDSCPEPQPSEETAVPYVELRITVPVSNPKATRANPMGGEEGNGRERGILHEDDIHDINVFFYIEDQDDNGTGMGMDSGEETKIIRHIYYNLENPADPQNTPLWIPDPTKDDDPAYDDTKFKPYFEKGYVVIRFQCTKEDIKNVEQKGGINFVTVANIGPMQFPGGMTLGGLRTADLKYYSGSSWTATYNPQSKNAADMDYFLMSTAYNENHSYGEGYATTGSNKITKNGNEYLGTTTLQRLYARLDLWYNKSMTEGNNAVTTGSGTSEKVTELKYQVVGYDDKPIKDDKGTVITNTVYLTNVLPVNVMQKPSFLFKMVTKDVSSFNASSLSYALGSDLSCVLNSENYLWGGKESLTDDPYTSNSSYNDRPTNYVIERHTLHKTPSGSIKEGVNQTLNDWYGNTEVSKVKGKNPADSDFKEGDNANSIRNADNGKLSVYYHGSPNSGSNPDYGCNWISIIGYANENTHPTDCYHSNYLTGMAFRGVYVPEKIYGTYEKVTGEDGNSSWKLTAMGSDEIPSKIYRYSPSADEVKESESIYFSDEDAYKAYQTQNPEDMAVVTAFDAVEHDGVWGFVCYYNLWLKHYDDVDDENHSDPHAVLPMQYATVRNNIYRVAVSFTGPGDPEPTMREPNTIKARIFVRKWNQRLESTPMQF